MFWIALISVVMALAVLLEERTPPQSYSVIRPATDGLHGKK
jgi:hypothetical protein